MAKPPNFQAILDNIAATRSMLSARTVVHDGKLIGPGVKASQNLVKHTEVAPTAAEAEINKKYRDARLGQLHGEVSDEEVDAIATKYIENIASQIVEGI